MKKLLMTTLSVAVALSSSSVFAANGTIKESAKSKVIVESKMIVGDLKMEDSITITSAMVAEGKDQTFQIAQFCTYTNDKDGKANVNVTTNEGKFEVVGTNGEGDLPYSLAIAGQGVKYGDNVLTVDPNDSPAGCKTVETVSMTFTGDNIRNAKAGTYNASFNLSTS
ncbi:hypothetical protein M9194_04185 [Vibrio sp. S4M6]|uniref:hypothetical protein n=1 Tax=Vibrio sinus TaxID=2946865 RepID=UPI00202A2A0D|nr:hypothetical protein [Vibrio sinus]MCL9780634.1 hypothetical protein [Vibrio sinus]